MIKYLDIDISYTIIHLYNFRHLHRSFFLIIPALPYPLEELVRQCIHLPVAKSCLLVEQVQEIEHDVVLIDLADHVCDLAFEEWLSHYELLVHILNEISLSLHTTQHTRKVLHKAVYILEITVRTNLRTAFVIQFTESEQVIDILNFLCHKIPM